MAFSLKSIAKTGQAKPPRMIIYGQAGVGKSTFACSADKPVVIRTEDGLDAIKVDAFPVARAFADVMDALASLITEDHDFKSVVLDSADWCEKLIERQVAADVGLTEFNQQAKELSYGRGNKAVAEYWRAVIDGLDVLRNEKGMAVFIVAHSQIKRFDDPTTDAYDRYILDLNKESAAVLTEWCDILGFAGFRISVKEETVGINGKKKRGLSDGTRYLYTQERPAWAAKSRHGIPEQMPLVFDEFASALAAAQA